jgi:hypothetical protein
MVYHFLQASNGEFTIADNGVANYKVARVHFVWLTGVYMPSPELHRPDRGPDQA